MTTTAPAVKVAAPRTTRAASLVVIVGVLAQAVIAGGFLSGGGNTDIHMLVGIPILISAVVLVGAGLVPRRSRPEPRARLIARLGVFLAVLTTALVGMMAAGGTRFLLMAHIPLAVVSLGLAVHLLETTRG